MSTKTSILFIGATGYVGGSVLTKLLAHPDVKTFEITVLVRSAEKAHWWRSSLKLPMSSSLCSDDLPSIRAILMGLRQRHEKTGDIPVLIHTSGMGVLTSQTYGMAVTDMIYDDSNFEQVASIDPAAHHRNVDNVVFEADKEGYCRTYIVVPGLIYGLAKTPLVDAGIQNKYSFPIQWTIKSALDRRQSGVVGKGLSLWANVHVDDQADFFIVLYDAIVKNGPDNVAHGIRGYYYGESGELSWYEWSQEIGRVLFEHGLAAGDEPTSYTREELVKHFGSEEIGNAFGTNSRARGTRSRSLGWKPKHTNAGLISSMKETVEAILREQKEY